MKGLFSLKGYIKSLSLAWFPNSQVAAAWSAFYSHMVYKFTCTTTKTVMIYCQKDALFYWKGKATPSPNVFGL